MSSELITKKLNEILKHIGVKPEVVTNSEDESLKIAINGDNLNFLVGYRGESLSALQTLLSTMIFNETNEWPKIVVDINGYRDSRQNRVEDMVRSNIDRVRFHGDDVSLPTMNSYERRQVHIFVTEYPDIVSESAGEGRNRRVVLKLVKD